MKNALQWKLWNLPFFDARHEEIESRMTVWRQNFPALEADIASLTLDEQCRAIARALGASGLLAYAVPDTGQGEIVDVRSVSAIREALAYDSALVDFVFAMQGIGSAAIWRHGSSAMQATYLDGVRRGTRIAAFAMSEPDGSSDVASLSTIARREGEHYVIDGVKTWISNGGIADQYIVIARTEDVPGSKGLSALLVDADTPGLSIESRIDIISPHPLATLRFNGCRVSAERLLGEPGAGFKLAMGTLDIFRTSVGAAAVGIARRALNETLDRVRSRKIFGVQMSDMDTVRMKIADMTLDLEAAAMLVYRAAWLKDTTDKPVTREVALAKLGATEAAQRVVDSAVQLFGGTGVTVGSVIERLYRDVRPMRIYEGASEIQKLIIGKRMLS
ncbi:acyl-CoA dehydrogenase family protein [Cupriavidus numazuensis]|uniref:Acyl-CoA dehydrogenase fadE25 n=1 Tax=Cupriavidus numazuensis TaxID=221992 RepID=A0ABN7Q266_9BURK|nr:acyl-CoA dehydrogenase family protein [Cupriavidus numazuensis]CAG2154113.1 putative acyl-CoA dehydrogenase fadE25 [Cupriavidus numazuensis]